jgi:L-ribulose-5-phosphate 3-epimerase
VKFGAMEHVLGTTAPEVFAVAALAGVAGVEIDWGFLDEARPGGRLGPEHRAGLRAAAQAAGIEIPSVCAGFLNAEGSLAHPDSSRQQVGLDAARLGLLLCRDLGARVLLLPFFGLGRIADSADVERLITHLKVLAPEAEAVGVTLGIEHTLSAEAAVNILREVGSPWVKDYWDMANAMTCGYNPVSEVRTLGPLLAQIHAKEYQIEGGASAVSSAPRVDGINTVPLGAGSVPLSEIMVTLRQVGYDGYIVLETEPTAEPWIGVRADLARLHAALGTP